MGNRLHTFSDSENASLIIQEKNWFFEEIFDIPRVFLRAEQESAVIFCRRPHDYSKNGLQF